MTISHILVLNSGSSSIKFSFYKAGADERSKLLEGAIDGIGGSAGASRFQIKSWMKSGNEAGSGATPGTKIIDESTSVPDLAAAFEKVADGLKKLALPTPTAIGHRMVCGGPTVIENQLITPALIDEMERYTAFAPLHTPAAIYIMRHAAKLFSGVPNYVCLDSYFHRNLPEVTRYLPIPTEYSAMGLRRFGAHGLSYESIVAHLQPNAPRRLIVAHLGNGASICAIREGASVDTSMGLTPTGGIISGTRSGDIDPGVLLFMLRKVAESRSDSHAADELETIINKRSGLLGLSDLDNDMRALRKAIGVGNARARLAVDEFVYVLCKYIGGYFAVLGGLDMLVFTGGIGEHDAATRAEVCAGVESLGIAIDADRNNSHDGETGEATISAEGSRIAVRVIPPAEDLMIVNHVCGLLEQ